MSTNKKKQRPKGAPVTWDLKVKRVGKDSYTTTFRVGAQYFELARVEEHPEAKQHCEFIQSMFFVALANLGVEKPAKGQRTEMMTVRLNSRESEMALNLATYYGLSTSAMLRMLLAAEIKRRKKR